ncbi:hypothetical protein Drorol1_Dr00028187 [Drosera rotundifolia]
MVSLESLQLTGCGLPHWRRTGNDENGNEIWASPSFNSEGGAAVRRCWTRSSWLESPPLELPSPGGVVVACRRCWSRHRCCLESPPPPPGGVAAAALRSRLERSRRRRR